MERSLQRIKWVKKTGVNQDFNPETREENYSCWEYKKQRNPALGHEKIYPILDALFEDGRKEERREDSALGNPGTVLTPWIVPLSFGLSGGAGSYTKLNFSDRISVD